MSNINHKGSLILAYELRENLSVYMMDKNYSNLFDNGTEILLSIALDNWMQKQPDYMKLFAERG